MSKISYKNFRSQTILNSQSDNIVLKNIKLECDYSNIRWYLFINNNNNWILLYSSLLNIAEAEGIENSASRNIKKDDDDSTDEDDPPEADTVLFIKGLNFDTREEAIKEVKSDQYLR